MLQPWYWKILMPLSVSLPFLDIIVKFFILIMLIKIYRAINDKFY